MTVFLKRILFFCLGGLLITIFFTLEYFGITWHNSIFTCLFPIQGLDVSHHQGKINWQKVADTKKFSFVYIKATEGHDFIDQDFNYNWQEAQKYGLKVGAYHFFSTRSSGLTQANYFIDTVPKYDSFLPPVIDIEIDTDKDPTKIKLNLTDLLEKLENHYQKKPILYVTYHTYNAYIKDDFLDHPIWIRDIVKYPYLKNRSWQIWQYSNRGKVNGINTFVDLNYFKNSL